MVDDEGDERSGPFANVPGSTIWTALIEHRFAYLALWDALSWAIAITLATLVRYDLQADSVDWDGLLATLPIVIGVQLLVGIWQGLYVGRWHLGSFEEIAALLRTVLAAAAVLFLLDLPLRWVPISVPIA